LSNDPPPGRHGYGINLICLCLRLVLDAGVSLRGVPRVLMVLADALGLPVGAPHWTTIRLWLMRLGHAELTLPLRQADDWAWLADHSVQIGNTKCLAIVGIRLRDLPTQGECLEHHDLHLIALVPSASWTKQDVDRVFEEAAQRTGVPRVIVNDHGGDLHGGTQLFRERHPQTAEIYDAKHKAACLLKQRLEKEPRWQEFQSKVGSTRCAVQQTELAFLTPPAPKLKARYMNLQAQLEWAEGVLAILRDPPGEVQKWTTPERLQAKFGWLTAFAEPLTEWSEWQTLVNLTVEFVDRQGVYRGMGRMLRQQMPRKFAHVSSRKLAKELIRFVVQQARQTKPGERFPGSTEVLESCFGKLKQLQKQQARGGFTSLVISFGSLLAETTTQVVNAALQHSSTQKVLAWCKHHLGTTVFAQRKIAFADGATKPG
jgi:hypothetical protein